MLNEESRKWEDWIVDYGDNGHDDDSNGSWWSKEFDGNGGSVEDVRSDPTDLVPEKGFVESVRDLVFGREEEDLLYEDRVFRYASLNSVRTTLTCVLRRLNRMGQNFAAPYAIVMQNKGHPYVKTVPLAAQMLDVRKNQKLEMIKEIKLEKARLKLEVEIGKSPPLSDEEEWRELRHKAEEQHDFVLALLAHLCYLSDSSSELRLNAFYEYHSESGWQTLLEHYGLEVDQSAITIFICLVPVVIDACVKLWLFKYLPRLSPKVANIFREMKRH
ncbi:hypothetical protein D5086_032593 [Populus alba]|uniref:Uncharacterized protein n=1 Tax=Populus alba TaxID=43335 RepID=A0ACC4ALR6_POPAL